MTKKSLGLDENVYSYLLRVGVRDSEVLERLREETAKEEMSRMQIAPEQGQFMHMLVKMLGVRRVIEIGVFTGYSSLCLADALPEDGELIACDIDEYWTSIAQRFWREAGVEQRIQLRLAPALETLNVLLESGEAGKFDLAFIDADKTNYHAYYEACLRLLRPGGVILLDNVLWSGRVASPDDDDEDTRALRAINDYIYRDDRIDMVMLPIADGLTLVRKKD